MTGRWYFDAAIVVAALAALNGILLWLNCRRYPLCPHCGTNARVYRDDGLPTCVDHGVVTKWHPDDRHASETREEGSSARMRN